MSDEIEQGLQRLIEEHGGDAAAAAAVLYRDNYKLREKLRALRQQYPEGTVPVAAEDADLLGRYRTLGTPDAISDLQREYQTLRTQYDQMQRALLIRKAAEQHGWRASVLEKVLGNVTVKDGETITVVDGDRAVPIDEYVTTRLAEFVPVLRGTSFPQQQIAKPTVDPIEQFIMTINERRRQRPNPLARE
jgi:hypothetical protein